MRLSLLTAILMLLPVSFSSGQSTNVEQWLVTNALSSHKGYKVVEQRRVDVTFDGRPEVLIAFEDTTDGFTPAPFFIVGIREDSSLVILLRHNNLVQCRSCGGAFSDIGSFDVDSQGIITFLSQYGSRDRGERFVSIRFDQSSQRWEVLGTGYSWYDVFDPNGLAPGSSGSWCLQSKNFPNRIFVDSTLMDAQSLMDVFSHHDYYQVTKQRVKLTKSCEDTSEQPAYLLKGDVVISQYLLKDSIACAYTIRNTRTLGFIPKTAVALVRVKELTDEPYTINVGKAYFHSAPNPAARLKNYVVKGDSLTCAYQLGAYTYCSFEKSSSEEVKPLFYGFFQTDALRKGMKQR